MQIIKYETQGPIEDFTILSAKLEFKGDLQDCQIELKRLKSLSQEFYGVAFWRDGFVCENESGRAEIAYDICD